MRRLLAFLGILVSLTFIYCSPKKGGELAKRLARREKAEKFLIDVLNSADKKIRMNQINNGNFSIGVKEYIDLPEIQYDPDIGIIGFDVAVTLERPGFRVKHRAIKTGKIGKRHLVSAEEAMTFVKKRGIEVKEEK